MPYLISDDTAAWIRQQKGGGVDIRSRHRVGRPGGGDEGGGNSAILAQASSTATPWAGIPVRLYANGAAQSSTGNGTAYLADVVAGSEVPANMWLIVWPGLVKATGGSDS